MSQSTTIRAHNDRFRCGDEEVLGSFVITAQLAAHLHDQGVDLLSITELVRTYDQFNEDTDPRGEHDFGRFQCAGELCYWKIDLFDLDLQYYPSDPTDLSGTRRVLTIMLATDY